MRFTHARTTAGYQSPHQVVIGGTLWHRLGLAPVASAVATGVVYTTITSRQLSASVTARRLSVSMAHERASVVITTKE